MRKSAEEPENVKSLLVNILGKNLYCGFWECYALFFGALMLPFIFNIFGHSFLGFGYLIFAICLSIYLFVIKKDFAYKLVYRFNNINELFLERFEPAFFKDFEDLFKKEFQEYSYLIFHKNKILRFKSINNSNTNYIKENAYMLNEGFLVIDLPKEENKFKAQGFYYIKDPQKYMEKVKKERFLEQNREDLFKALNLEVSKMKMKISNLKTWV